MVSVSLTPVQSSATIVTNLKCTITRFKCDGQPAKPQHSNPPHGTRQAASENVYAGTYGKGKCTGRQTTQQHLHCDLEHTRHARENLACPACTHSHDTAGILRKPAWAWAREDSPTPGDTVRMEPAFMRDERAISSQEPACAVVLSDVR